MTGFPLSIALASAAAAGRGQTQPAEAKPCAVIFAGNEMTRIPANAGHAIGSRLKACFEPARLYGLHATRPTRIFSSGMAMTPNPGET